MRMQMLRDVYPVRQDIESDDANVVVQSALQKLWQAGALVAGDRVLVTMGDRMNRSGGTNTLRFIKLDEEGRSYYGV
jgi:pyruvate kinase